MSESKFVGCMLGSATGDAIGSSFEGLPPRDLRFEDHRFSGRWTDDTHMMIGVAESLIANRGFNGEHMAWAFIKNWEEEPWRGYGPGPPRVFRMIKSGVPWERAAKQLYGGAGSFGNGAAMRVAPVGLLYYDDPDELRAVAYASAEITHTHELGKEGAAIQAFAVALAVRAEPKNFEAASFLQKLREFTKNEVYKKKLEKAETLLDRDEKRRVIRELGNGVKAQNSVPTAIYCFAKNHHEYAKAVLYAVSLGGDTDTIAAMTGAIAGALQGSENIPTLWKQRLERRGYIETLAKKLWKLKNSRLNQPENR